MNLREVSLRAGFLAVMVFGLISPLRAETRAYPVPWLARESGPNIIFTDLPGSGSIKIFTVAGEEVINISIPPGTDQLSWPVTNASGRKVASGVYYFLVQGGGEQTKGKLIVIR